METPKLRRLLTKAAALSCLLLAAAMLPCPAEDSVGDPLCVSNVQTEDAGGGRIRLSWSLPEGSSRGQVLFFAIYRDQRPIYSSTRVKSLFPIAAVPKNHVSYTDETDGKSYYYAVLTFVDRKGEDLGYQDLYYDEELDGPGGEGGVKEDGGMLYAAVLPGINATISSARASSTGTPSMAGTPAPSQTTHTAPSRETAPSTGADRTVGLAASQAPSQATGADRTAASPQRGDGLVLMEEAETRNKERNISPQAERSASQLVGKGRQKPTPLFRHIFSEDQVVPPGGDDYLLYKVLQEGWMQGRYAEAKAGLSSFLAQRRDDGATKRATFYLAEAEYFTGNYTGALNLFLTVQDSFPALAGKWIDSCIDFYDGW